MPDSRPTWVLVAEAAQRLSGCGAAPFKLAALCADVQRADPSRERATIQPVVQGMTANAGKGPTSPCGKILERIDHGYYRLRPDSGRGIVNTPPPRVRPKRGGQRSRVLSVDEVEARADDLIANFAAYVETYDARAPFDRVGQYDLHRATIDRRLALGSVAAAIADDSFTRSLHDTLQKWGIGRRGSRLVPLDIFRQRLRSCSSEISKLECFSLESSSTDTVGVTHRINELIDTIAVVENRARIVAGTKTLHHLLPNLVPPMDRAWTGVFFGWSLLDPQDHQCEILAEAMAALSTVAQSTRPSRLVGAGWRTSPTKILDNALIAYCMTRGIGGGGA